MAKQHNCLDRLHEMLGGDKQHYSPKLAGKENGKSFRATVPDVAEAFSIAVDQGIYPKGHITTKKCDFVVVGCSAVQKDFHFIELKGDGVTIDDDMARQLGETLRMFKGQHEPEKHANLNADKHNLLKGSTFAAHIVGGSIPRAKNAFRDLKDNFRKTHGCSLSCENSPFEFPLLSPQPH